MALRIRLARKGRKNMPIYSIVVARSTSPRDGKFVEKLGIYDPIKKTFDLNIERSVKWLLNGAQPSETAKTLLSKKGVLLKKHLQLGVLKGAKSQEKADEEFAAWVSSCGVKKA